MFGIQTVEGFRGIFLFVDVCVFLIVFFLFGAPQMQHPGVLGSPFVGNFLSKFQPPPMMETAGDLFYLPFLKLT